MRTVWLGIVVVLVAGVVVVGYLFRDQLSGSVQDLKVGDCFEVPAGDQVNDVQHRPCTQAHDGEVFVVEDFTGSDTYPSLADFEAWTRDHCLGNAFETYVGDSYDNREDVSVGYLYPLADGWSRGDREMTCYLSPADGNPVSSSYRKGGS